MTKQDTINKLTEIEDKIKEILNLSDYVENGNAQEFMTEVDAIKNELGCIEKKPIVFDNLPIFFNSKENDINQKNNKKERYFKYLKIVGIATIALFLICLLPFVNSFGFIGTLRNAGILASIIIAYFFFSTNNELKKKKSEEEQKQAEFEKSYNSFAKHLETYEDEKNEGIAIAKEYGKRYKKAYEIQKEKIEIINNKKTEAMQKYVDINKEIDAESPVPREYLHFIPKLILFLKSGRADTLKEALNLAIEEERIRERDEALLAEERKRTAIEQQRQENERLHQLEMERQAEMQTRAAMDQADAAEKQAKAAQDQARATERAAQNQAQANQGKQFNRCGSCKHYRHCAMRDRGGANCGGFSPI